MSFVILEGCWAAWLEWRDQGPGVAAILSCLMFTLHHLLIQVVMEQIHELKSRLGEMERARRTVEGELHQLSLQVHQASSRLLQLRDK